MRRVPAGESALMRWVYQAAVLRSIHWGRPTAGTKLAAPG